MTLVFHTRDGSSILLRTTKNRVSAECESVMHKLKKLRVNISMRDVHPVFSSRLSLVLTLPRLAVKCYYFKPFPLCLSLKSSMFTEGSKYSTPASANSSRLKTRQYHQRSAQACIQLINLHTCYRICSELLVQI